MQYSVIQGAYKVVCIEYIYNGIWRTLLHTHWFILTNMAHSEWFIYKLHNINLIWFMNAGPHASLSVCPSVCVFVVSTQQSDVQNGVMSDERLSSPTLQSSDPSMAGCALCQQLLLQSHRPRVPLLHRRHVLAPCYTQELWIRACTTLSRIRLY